VSKGSNKLQQIVNSGLGRRVRVGSAQAFSEAQMLLDVDGLNVVGRFTKWLRPELGQKSPNP
jgi:hypothetical protein